MQLLNFELVSDPLAELHGIAITAQGFEWDLHNHAEFEGFEYRITVDDATLTLTWHLSSQVVQWRDSGQYLIPNYPTMRFALVFCRVNYLEVSHRDPAMPVDEDRTLVTVSSVEEGEDLIDYSGPEPAPYPDKKSEIYHIMFRFNGGQEVRVASETAEFISSGSASHGAPLQVREINEAVQMRSV